MSKERDYFVWYMIAFYYCVTWAGYLAAIGQLTLEFAGVITAALTVAKLGDSANYYNKKKAKLNGLEKGQANSEKK